MSIWDKIVGLPIIRWATISYSPNPSECEFRDSAQTVGKEGVSVSLAVLDPQQARQYFGIPMAKRGVQPIWIRIVNQSKTPCRLHLVSIDPNYYSSHEAACVNHYSTIKRLLEFGILGWLFVPLLLILPLRMISAWRANKRMDEFFRDYSFRLRPITPGMTTEGFVFTPVDAGNKIVHLRLLRWEGMLEFDFNIQVAGIEADYQKRDFTQLPSQSRLVECDLSSLREHLRKLPRAVTGANGRKEGDPVNLIVVGEFPTVMSAFGARWDETETITFATCWKTTRSFLTGSEYRYSPVSPLYLFGRSQDFALQRVRSSVNERLHLRLWITEYRLGGKPVWVGQISRDIGVRFTIKTWNLTTHRIDPDVDESRDYVLEDLLGAERAEMVGYVDGVGECTVNAPRRNLTGDPYYTDGQRALAVVSSTRAKVELLRQS